MKTKHKHKWEIDIAECPRCGLGNYECCNCGEVRWNKDEMDRLLDKEKRRIIREIEEKLELDIAKHSQGVCTFALTSLCSAEEQRIKMLIRGIIYPKR